MQYQRIIIDEADSTINSINGDLMRQMKYKFLVLITATPNSLYLYTNGNARKISSFKYYILQNIQKANVIDEKQYDDLNIEEPIKYQLKCGGVQQDVFLVKDLLDDEMLTMINSGNLDVMLNKEEEQQ